MNWLELQRLTMLEMLRILPVPSSSNQNPLPEAKTEPKSEPQEPPEETAETKQKRAEVIKEIIRCRQERQAFNELSKLLDKDPRVMEEKRHNRKREKRQRRRQTKSDSDEKTLVDVPAWLYAIMEDSNSFPQLRQMVHQQNPDLHNELLKHVKAIRDIYQPDP